MRKASAAYCLAQFGVVVAGTFRVYFSWFLFGGLTIFIMYPVIYIVSYYLMCYRLGGSLRMFRVYRVQG